MCLEELQFKLTDFMRSRNMEEDMAENRHLRRLGVTKYSYYITIIVYIYGTHRLHIHESALKAAVTNIKGDNLNKYIDYLLNWTRFRLFLQNITCTCNMANGTAHNNLNRMHVFYK